MDSEKRLKRLIAVLLTALFFVGTPQSSLASGLAATHRDYKSDAGVYIITGSTINLVSRESNIPIQIQNTFDAEITVHLHVQATNPKVVVQRAVAVKLPPLTTVTAKVPVRAVANGDVNVVVWLETFSGHNLGDAMLLRMKVNAEMELAFLLGFGAIILALLIGGLIRTTQKNRRRQARLANGLDA